MTPKAMPPKTMTAKTMTPKTAPPKTAAPKATTPKVTSTKATAPKATTPKVTSPKVTSPKVTGTPKSFRCPECYARVVIEPDDDAKSALWLHGLSGRCRAKQTPKAEKPRRKERLEAMLGEEWG
jgi:hypothetical protein